MDFSVKSCSTAGKIKDLVPVNSVAAIGLPALALGNG